MVSSLLWHTLQRLSWTNPFTAFHDLVYFICSSIVIIENVLAQPEMTFVFLFLLELALLFLCRVFHSPWFHCFLKTCLHFPPRWFPFSLFINHLITKPYQFLFKVQSHSNFLHCLHWFHNNCILLLDCLSPCSFNPSIGQLSHVAGDLQSCLLVSIPQRLQSSSAFLFLHVQLFITFLLPNLFFLQSSLLIVWSSSFSSPTLTLQMSIA